jgi:protein disulfide-isomerase A1
MRSSLVSQAVSLIALAFLATAESASDVLSLTAANFDSSVKPEPLILVEFFAPW